MVVLFDLINIFDVVNYFQRKYFLITSSRENMKLKK